MMIRYGFTLADLPESLRDEQTAVMIANRFFRVLQEALPSVQVDVQFSGAETNLGYRGLHLHVPLADEDRIRTAAQDAIARVIAAQEAEGAFS